MEIVDLQTLHQAVWATRRKIEDQWPSPPPDDALRFSITEVAEMVDAVLRQNPSYKRNHRKQVNLDQEVAHCAIMLLTALGEKFDWEQDRIVTSWGYWQTGYQVAVRNGYQGSGVDWVVNLCADALTEMLWPVTEGWEGDFCIIQALVALDDTGVDVVAAVERELKRMEVKHG